MFHEKQKYKFVCGNVEYPMFNIPVFHVYVKECHLLHGYEKKKNSD